jgi:hypothetical protein
VAKESIISGTTATITFFIWMVAVVTFAGGFVVGNTLQADMSIAGILCEGK